MARPTHQQPGCLAVCLIRGAASDRKATTTYSFHLSVLLKGGQPVAVKIITMEIVSKKSGKGHRGHSEQVCRGFGDVQGVPILLQRQRGFPDIHKKRTGARRTTARPRGPLNRTRCQGETFSSSDERTETTVLPSQ